MASIALNGNASVVLFVGLGCENNQITLIKQQLQHHNTSHIFFLTAQDETDEVLAGFNLIKEAVTNASKLKREPCSYSSLKIGLKCGGSDALSGITANPLVGQFSDALIASGGSAVLTEVPEMFGAEHILMDKCKDKQTFNALVKLVNDYKMDYKLQGFNVYENPSPGNKAGGISTLEEKSLGCVQKAGQSNIVDVVEYGSLVTKQGLSILSAPGNDLIASTALGACGCQLVLFTTGRGTPFSTFVPTLKISSNTALFNKKANWIDYNAQGATIASFIDFVDAIINGKQQCLAEDNREIAFFKKGVTL